MDNNSFDFESTAGTESNSNQNPTSFNDFNKEQESIPILSSKEEDGQKYYNPEAKESSVQDAITELQKQNEEYNNRLGIIENKLDLLSNASENQENFIKEMQYREQKRDAIKIAAIVIAISGGVGYTIGEVTGRPLDVEFAALATVLASGAVIFEIWNHDLKSRLDSRIDSAQGEERTKLEKRKEILGKIISSATVALTSSVGLGIGGAANLFLR